MTTILPSPVQNPHEAASVQSTPGLEIPGAFPREHTAATRQHPLSDSRRTAPDRPDLISLPSTEKEGTHPGEHYDGIGPLPGSISETSVAKLPDERASEAKVAPAPVSRLKEMIADTDPADEGFSEADAAAIAVAPASSSIAKVPDEQGEATSESALKSKERAADTDPKDNRPYEAAAVAPDSSPVTKVPGEWASGEAAAESALKSTRGGDDGASEAVVVAPDSSPVTKVLGEWASGEAAAEAALKSKELSADRGGGDDAREGVRAATSGAPPGETKKQDTSPVPRTDPQRADAAVGEQVPAVVRRAEARVRSPPSSPFVFRPLRNFRQETAEPADSKMKFKEELRREEKSRGAFSLSEPPPPSPRPAVAEDLAPPTGVDEDPDKAAPVQQQQQQKPEIAGGQGPRKGRSSSDSDPAKASIMNRVKGEMKVLLGKASGNRDKVEEGERMKHGTQ